ncbi:NADH dehydrogenase 1 alpha subcomplex assembly factor 3 [Pelagophyceae sp. CCMP2097]|nr:NADH dehydrogenase 1 alpha subcomplex assembly factor 3 [Pelagophyceae sp. CCMP2097]
MLRCAAAARRCARVPRARRVLSDDASEFGFGGAANLRFTDVTHGERPRLQITEADGGGFTLLGDVYVPSSIIAMTFGALLWSPRTLAEITLESVAIFTVMHPRPDLVVIGGGTTAERRLTHVREYLREEGIGLEMMDTYNALNTFNILNAEGRQVAGALLTLQPREFYATVRDLS